MVNFHATIDGKDFEFHTVNTARKQLYQIYVDHEGKRHRFHMQVTNEAVFRIADRNNCPDPLLQYEDQLSDTIIQS